MSENLKRNLLTNLPFSVVSVSLFKGLTWMEFGITKAIKMTLKSYIQNTSAHIIPIDFNNIPEVRPLDPSRRGHGAGFVLYMTLALPCLGKKPIGPEDVPSRLISNLSYSRFQKVRIPNFLPKKPCVHFRAVRASYPSGTFWEWTLPPHVGSGPKKWPRGCWLQGCAQSLDTRLQPQMLGPGLGIT